MTNKYVFVILLALLATACSSRPREVLSKKQMIDVLVDLHRTEGMLQATNRIYDRNNEASSYYQATLSKHGVTQAQFDSSLVWYTDHPKRFNKIYPKVMQQLQSELDAYNALHPDVPFEIDEQDIILPPPEVFPPLEFTSEQWESIPSQGLPLLWNLPEPEPFTLIVNPE